MTIVCNCFFVDWCRIWMTYYQYRSSQVMADNGWIIMLLLGVRRKQFETNVNTQTNLNEQEKCMVEKYYSHWTIKYANTLGNKRFMRNIVISIVFILNSITFVSMCIIHYAFNDSKNYDKYYGLLLLSQMLCLFFLSVIISIFAFYKVSKFTDFIYIKQEILGIYITGYIMAAFFIGWTMFDYHNDLVEETKEGIDPMTTVFWFFIISLSSFMLCSITLSCVIYKYNPNLLKLKLSFNLFCWHCDCSCCSCLTKSPQKSRRSSYSCSQLNGGQLSLGQLLTHETGYKLFMRYLVDHMAMECLLFLTEMAQFKKLKIFERLNRDRIPASNENKNNINIDFHIRKQTKQLTGIRFVKISIPSDVPQSLIMSDEYNIFEKVMMLRNRYINDYASLQINISYQHRETLDAQLHKLQQQYTHIQQMENINEASLQVNIEQAIDIQTLTKLYIVFDEALEEMFALLASLFREYRHTEVLYIFFSVDHTFVYSPLFNIHTLYRNSTNL